ncbi:MAG: sugar phosphate isomerase/epimerase family protein [Nitrososphaerota archaeon]
MKYGVLSLLWTNRFSEKHLGLFDKLHKMGYDGLEIYLGYPEILPISGIKNKMRETGLECTFAIGLDKNRNVADPDPEVRKKGIKFLKGLIEIVSELNGDVLCGIPYAAWGELSPKGRQPQELEYAKQAMREVADYARDHGVFLALEPVNRFEGYLINTAEEMITFVKDVNHPNVKILLDTFQMLLEENNLCEAIRASKDYLYHFHACENHRGVLGTGYIPWKDIFKTLKDIGYNRWLVYEAWSTRVFLSELGEIPPKIAMWRQLIADEDQAAEKSLNFLKKMEKCV